MPLSIGGSRRAEGRCTSSELVERAEAYLRAHDGAPVTIAKLSRAVGRSERGLRNAFHGVHGMSPKRWIVTERLRAVRQALCSARDAAVTVTSVAAEHGFQEFGRFAKTYKQQYGEAPSATLRGTGRKMAHGK